MVEAANYGYATKNRSRTWGFHTPEEESDDDPQTPMYLARTKRNASYTYFVSTLGFIFQLVPESEGAYAHALNGKPEPAWSDGTNLNLQSFSLSFEGYAATIHQTMPRGDPQWNAAVDLVAHRTKALDLNLDIAFQHKDVSVQRSDCGQWDQAAFIADVKTKMQSTEEEDMPKLIQLKGTQAIAVFNDVYKLQGLRSEFIAYFYPGLKVDQVSQADWDSIPDAHGVGQLEEEASKGEIDEARMRTIAREEDNRLEVTKR